MRKSRVLTAGAVTASLLVVGSAAASAAPSNASLRPAGQAPEAGVGVWAGQGSQVQVPSGKLSTSEKKQLIFLAEEEKLAHDLYVLAYDLYGIRTFANISRAEVRHFNSMNNLLERYGLPSKDKMGTPGKFKDPDLQAAYDKLAKRVRSSAVEAAAVGVLAEKGDIADLRAAIKGSMPADVDRVLSNLVRASKKHLSAFTRLGKNLSAGRSITVKAKTVASKSKIKVNVNPNLKASNYRFQVQKKVNGKWKTVKTVRTKGAYDTRVVNMPKGKYRIKVPAQYGMSKAFSDSVYLRR